ncbi:MAG: hypothetical protein GBAus27B_000243 [Mycoplasmataceae bacterium]|nr:MAG: hypothetical protein GBAus27B_000243 [Mycoplasmataceae bacterium]
MGVARWVGEVVGYTLAPWTYGASLALAKSARDSVGDLSRQIRGEKVESDLSKKTNYERQMAGEFDKINKKLAEIEKATGISQEDNIEKIKEIKENFLK